YCPDNFATHVVTVLDPNTVTSDGRGGTDAPIANAGTDQTVNPGSSVRLDGSSKPTNALLEWTQVGGPAVELRNTTSSNPTFTAPTEGVLTFAIRAAHGNAVSAFDWVVIRVAPNPGPVAVAGQVISAKPGENVTIDGTHSVGNDLTYTWTQTQGPAIKIQDIHAPIARIPIPAGMDATTLAFTLTVADNGKISKDTAIVIVGEIPATAAPLTASPKGNLPFTETATQEANGFGAWVAIATALVGLAASILFFAMRKRAARRKSA
ncbi:MAG: hypothetical protein LC620_03360, partial [Halobacteriales archaeon]|nr:hypothetical protein [Halobacteriales archaeon]